MVNQTEMQNSANPANSPNDAAATRLTLDKDLTIYNVLEQKETLLNALASTKELELDLAKVNEIDTAGIQLLIFAKRESLKLGKPLRLSGHTTVVQEVIDFFNLGSYFGDPLVIMANKAA